MIQIPEVGQAVNVRIRLGVVRGVNGYDPKDASGSVHLVEVEYFDDYQHPQVDTLLWEVERLYQCLVLLRAAPPRPRRPCIQKPKRRTLVPRHRRRSRHRHLLRHPRRPRTHQRSRRPFQRLRPSPHLQPGSCHHWHPERFTPDAPRYG